MAVLVDTYRRLSCKRMIIFLNIWFVRQCISHQVTPTFAKVKTSKNVPDKEKQILEKKILKRELKKHYTKLHHINVNLKITYDQILQQHPWFLVNDSFNNIEDEVSRLQSTKKRNLTNKLNRLILQKQQRSTSTLLHKFSDHQFHPRVLNLSNTNFSEDELYFLGLGLKFSCQNFRLSDSVLGGFAVELDTLIEGMTNNADTKQYLRNSCISLLQQQQCKYKRNFHRNHHNFKKQKDLLKSIKQKIYRDSLVLSKADKGNCVVILEQTQYIEKVESFLSDNSFVVLEKNPLNTFINKTKAMVKLFNDTITKFNNRKLIVSNPITPRLYGLPKIHKHNCPIRPVVSFCNTPVSILSEFIYNTIQSITNFKPKFSIKNSLDLIERLNNIRIEEGFYLVSFDVSNLFTSVPRDETLPLVHNLLDNCNISAKDKDAILTILKFCLDQDFFQFNQKIYKQPTGLAMGSPLSPFLADIFLDSLEQKFVNNNNKIVFWSRYVDDCIALIQGTQDDALQILDDLNNLHPNISFTLEPESDKKLNFLDMTISRNKDSLEYNIYRKPTQTDHVIHDTSNHPTQHKMAAFNSYIHRLQALRDRTVTVSELQTRLQETRRVFISDQTIRNRLHEVRLNAEKPVRVPVLSRGNHTH
ncbi:uncharacterized protein [Diabrotica undecimpunctata]|uniref:uncharacterized protein n=1 Tax=Diabrotica undecimpunctata TaxID=50387 RepID=UPI003B63BDCF